MNDKTRKTLGWLCLVYSGLFLLSIIFTIIIPIKGKIKYDINWVFYLESLGMVSLVSALGYYLVWRKPDPNMRMRFSSYMLVLVPIVLLRVTTMVEYSQAVSDWLPLITIVMVIFSLTSICIPFLFGDRILRRQKEKALPSEATPLQMLYVIGLIWALAPATTGFFLYLLGSSKNMIYYLVVISYLSIAIWWAWWKHRYCRALGSE